MTIQITIDDREHCNDIIIGILSASEDVSLNIARLQYGDYVINNQLFFERKTFSDLSLSIADGRLFHQLSLLKAHTPHPVLIIEGGSMQLRNLKMSREAIQGAIITVELIYGIPILRSLNQEETAKLLLYSANQVMRHHSTIPYRHGHTPKFAPKQQLYILQGITGIGPKKAYSLLQYFGSIRAIFNANEEDLTSVPLIDTKTAQAILKVSGPIT